jgi:hypothetical protein
MYDSMRFGLAGGQADGRSRQSRPSRPSCMYWERSKKTLKGILGYVLLGLPTVHLTQRTLRSSTDYTVHGVALKYRTMQ